MSFQFKRFFIEDRNTSMKVGIDAVLLGAWADIGNGNQIVDIGSGNGIVSLMLAQRFPETNIHAVEINNAAFKDCIFNIDKSPFKERIEAINCDIRKYNSEIFFDIAISNPPFFSLNSAAHDNGRQEARQTKSLSYKDLCVSAKQLLKPNAALIVVFPFEQRQRFIKEAFVNGFYLKKELVISDKKRSKPQRSLLHFVNYPILEVERSSLYLKDTTNTPSKFMTELTKDFYL